MKHNHVECNAAEYDAHADGWVAAAENNGGHIFIEKPAIEALLPSDLSGKSVLCVGVGSGEEIAFILKRNPESIAAIDISEKLLTFTKDRYPTVETKVMDMADLTYGAGEFDLAFSSLTLHYAHDRDQVLAGFHRVLANDGMLVFSTHHPVRFNKNPTGQQYANERGVILTEHTDVFPGDISVIYYNHPDVASIQNALEHAGFSVEMLKPAQVVASNPRPDLQDMYDVFKQKNADRPLFLVCKAIKI